MKALILGGYGNFGKRIAALLTRKGVSVVIAGRDASKAEAVAKALPSQLAEYAAFDAKSDLARHLALLRPRVVIDSCWSIPEQRLWHCRSLHCRRRPLHRPRRRTRFCRGHYDARCQSQKAKCRRDQRRQYGPRSAPAP